MARWELIIFLIEGFGYCGFADEFWSLGRLKGFSDSLIKKGFKVYSYKQPTRKKLRAWEIEKELLRKWLVSLPKPIGILAVNDVRAQEVIDICTAEGISVPEKVAVLGIGNDKFVCELTRPPISSIERNSTLCGFRAAAMLDRLMSSKCGKVKNIIVSPTHVVTRQSTDILAVSDLELHKALNFIREKITDHITVDDVVGQTLCSRRIIEQRFKKTLGRSINNEIIRVRIEKACHLLTNPNLSVSEVARSLGYREVSGLTRDFKREKNISPKNYRKELIFGSQYLQYNGD